MQRRSGPAGKRRRRTKVPRPLGADRQETGAALSDTRGNNSSAVRGNPYSREPVPPFLR